VRSCAERLLWLVALVVVVASVSPAVAAPATVERPTTVAVRAALEKVKADPKLTPETTIKMLRWKDQRAPQKVQTPGWLAWIAEFFRWLDRSARILVWCAVAILVGLLAVFVVRLVRRHGERDAYDPFVAPTHVRDLDIRPESLPADIGSAARALWDAGEQRAALALLYRGLLSRLAHVHRVPIRDSSTEGECLALAAVHLTPLRTDFAAGLVRVWQRFVYGREEVAGAAVHLLCDGFADALDTTAPIAGAERTLA
jgi:hypothetical protein